jgi:LacI family transcriptional regulator
MPITIKKIAEMSGVHRSTVDKVLHKRVGVSDEVRQKVQAIIDETGYTPNAAGRVLQKQGRIYRIAAVLVEVDALSYLKEGIEKGIQMQIGFKIKVDYYITKFQEAEKQANILKKVIKTEYDGIIISPINSKIVGKAINNAVESGIPVVTTNSDLPGSKRLCCVCMDSLQASRIAGRIMGKIIGGKGEIAIISSAIEEENNNYYVAVREKGFVEFMGQNYPDIKIVECVESFEDPEITYQQTRKLLENYPKLKGIYLTCGGASEVGRALIKEKRSQDVTAVSYEDYPEILDLMKRDVIDCTLGGDIRKQGSLPVEIIMNALVFQKKPEREIYYTETKILVKESLY